MLSFVKKHSFFIFFFFSLYLAFLFPLVLLKQGFTRGDYEVQFYPWMWVYAQALKQGYLPLWTPLIQSGFPLFAEGQTAMLYGLNLLLFKILSFRAAYNGLFLLHFLMGGFFSYLFARKTGMSKEGGTLTALVFTFGSAYAGCFYGIFTMRPLVWFPLALYLAEKLMETGRWLFVFMLAFVLAQSALGGYPQAAAHGYFFLVLYYFLRVREASPAPQGHFRLHLLFFAGVILSVAAALPQVWATALLGLHSTRLLQERGFALWGSAPPWTPLTLFLYPWNIFLGANLYVGIFPFFLVLFFPFKKETKVWRALALVSFFFALGAFNPLCRLLDQLPLASLLRKPAKLLFFAAFALAMMAGHGWDAFWEKARRGGAEFRKAAGGLLRRTAWVSAGFLGIAVGGSLVSRWGGPILIRMAKWYVAAFVAGRSYHRWPMQVYEEKIHGILRLIRKETDFLSPFFWMPFLFALMFLAGVYFLKEAKIRRGIFKNLFFGLLLLDLFLYGRFYYGTGFIGNAGPFPDASFFGRFERGGKWLDITEKAEPIFPPNRNLLSSHSQAGAYSPLLDVRYYLLTKEFGGLDDSFGRARPLAERFEKSLPLLRFLGVRYVAADADFPMKRLSLLRLEGARAVYENPEPLPEFTFVFNQKILLNDEEKLSYLQGPRFDPFREAVTDEKWALDDGLREAGDKEKVSSVQALETHPLRALLKVTVSHGGMLVRNQVYDKGWEVFVAGDKKPLKRVNGAFQGVEVPPGVHLIEFVFRPRSFIIGRWFYGAGFLVMAAGILWGMTSKGRKGKHEKRIVRRSAGL